MTFEKILETVNKCPRGKVAVAVSGDGYEKELFQYISHDSNAITMKRLSGGHKIKLGKDDTARFLSVMFVKKNFQSKMRGLYSDKTPKNRFNHVGVELEFVSKLSETELKVLIADAGIEKFVTVKDDGSIDTSEGYLFSHEICLIGTEKTIHKIVHKVCELLAGNSRVNRSCGMHVHLDMRNRNPEKAYANLFASQPLLYSMCPPSRAKNDYCAPKTSYESFYDGDYEDDDFGDSRYVGINSQAYHKHKTIEVRIHSGTLSEEKISNWIKLLIRIADRPVARQRDAKLIKSYAEMRKKLRLSKKLDAYVTKRLEEFAPNHANTKEAIKIAA